MKNKTVISGIGGGIGFAGILQIVFIVLKLCGIITWRWTLVLLPIIIDVSLTILALLIVLFYLIVILLRDL